MSGMAHFSSGIRGSGMAVLHLRGLSRCQGPCPLRRVGREAGAGRGVMAAPHPPRGRRDENGLS